MNTYSNNYTNMDDHEVDYYDSEMEYAYDDDELEYDSEFDNDGVNGNWESAYDAGIFQTLIPERKSSRSPSLRVPSPVQLAAKTSQFKTMEQANSFLKKKAQDEAKEMEKQYQIEQEQLAKRKLEQMELERIEHEKFLKMLPRESAAGKEKRLEKEAEEQEQKEKEARKAQKKKSFSRSPSPNRV